MKKFRIAIDGPAGSGKSTVAKKVAEKLNFLYIDTGAMYRAIAFKALSQAPNIEAMSPELLKNLATESKIAMSIDENRGNHFFIDGVEVTEVIRTPEVSRAVSWVAKDENVRSALVIQQRNLAENQPVVMDGRDIGTCVFPDAELKVFLTASVEERAKRRWLELTKRGETIDLKELEAEITARDKMDEEREISPLIPAEDAVMLDTTALSIGDVVERLIELYEEKKQ